MSRYPEPDSRIRNKIKAELNLSKCATRKELEHASGVGSSDLFAKNILLL